MFTFLYSDVSAHDGALSSESCSTRRFTLTSQFGSCWDQVNRTPLFPRIPFRVSDFSCSKFPSQTHPNYNLWDHPGQNENKPPSSGNHVTVNNNEIYWASTQRVQAGCAWRAPEIWAETSLRKKIAPFGEDGGGGEGQIRRVRGNGAYGTVLSRGFHLFTL